MGIQIKNQKGINKIRKKKREVKVRGRKPKAATQENTKK